MIILGNTKDKFGFYQVGDRRTYSKIEAIDLHQQTGMHPHWNFNEEFFKSYNWTVEPKEDLQTLYARRAQQIRNTYDYVVLAYSGGIDSGNIIDTFVNNNIKIDEILTFNLYSSHGTTDHIDTAELHQVGWPKIKQLQDRGISFKHRNLDQSDRVLNILKDSKLNLDRSYYGNLNWGATQLSMTYLREVEPDYVKIRDSDKKMVFVWGIDKPRLYYENGKYCLKFLDMIDSGVRPRTQILNHQNEYDELFYWSPESVDIICKQGHTLKNFFKKYHKFVDTGDGASCNIINEYSGAIKSYINEHRGMLDVPEELKYLESFSQLDLTNWLVYQDFDPRSYFSVGKPKTRIFSPRESVFNSDPELGGKAIQYLIDKFSSIDHYWWNDTTNVYRGLKMCVSPTYYLE